MGYVLQAIVHAVAPLVSLWRTRKRRCVRYPTIAMVSLLPPTKIDPLPERVDAGVQHERPDIKARRPK
jgi:hypothetical protein